MSSIPLNAACRPNDAQIVPPSQEQPAEGQRDRDPSGERDDGQAERIAGGRTGDRQDMGEREHQGAADKRAADTRSPVPRPWWRRPGRAISSPNGATIAPARSDSANPAAVPVGGSGLVRG